MVPELGSPRAFNRVSIQPTLAERGPMNCQSLLAVVALAATPLAAQHAAKPDSMGHPM